jgi:hypothetical protein
MEIKMSAKPKYTQQHIAEILEMHKNGKTNAEIVKYLNEKYSLDASDSSIRTIIQRQLEKEKQQEQKEAVVESKKEQAELFPDHAKETIEKIFVLREEMDENYAKQKETAVLMEENYSRQKEAVALQEKSLENLAKLETKYEDSIEKHAILNGTLQETIIQNKEKRRNISIPYFIIGGFILTMALAMVVGYNSRRYNNPMSLHYLVVAGYILGGVIAGIGIGIVKKKITAMMEKKKSKSES